MSDKSSIQGSPQHTPFPSPPRNPLPIIESQKYYLYGSGPSYDAFMKVTRPYYEALGLMDGNQHGSDSSPTHTNAAAHLSSPERRQNDNNQHYRPLQPLANRTRNKIPKNATGHSIFSPLSAKASRKRARNENSAPEILETEPRRKKQRTITIDQDAFFDWLAKRDEVLKEREEQKQLDTLKIRKMELDTVMKLGEKVIAGLIEVANALKST